MYRHGHRARNKRKPFFWISFSLTLLVILVAGGILLAQHFVHGKTVITQSAAVVAHVNANSQTLQPYNEDDFSVSLPVGWKPTTREKQPYNVYRWQSSPGGELFEVYEDTIPQNFAVNRVLAVDENGAHVSVLGTVSDNCSDFTKTGTATTGGGVHAKWQGIDFLCDLNNYERNVVGTSSQNGINTLTLKGQVTGSHEFFFTYTDHNINPDYSVFYNVLNSFTVK